VVPRLPQLDTYCVSGVTHNASFLRASLTNPRYVAGACSARRVCVCGVGVWLLTSWCVSVCLRVCVCGVGVWLLPSWCVCSSGNLSTAFIPEEFPEGFKGVTVTPRLSSELAAVGAAMSMIWCVCVTTCL
jgi:hypothetical protein